MRPHLRLAMAIGACFAIGQTAVGQTRLTDSAVVHMVDGLYVQIAHTHSVDTLSAAQLARSAALVHRELIDEAARRGHPEMLVRVARNVQQLGTVFPTEQRRPFFNAAHAASTVAARFDSLGVVPRAIVDEITEQLSPWGKQAVLGVEDSVLYIRRQTAVSLLFQEYALLLRPQLAPHRTSKLEFSRTDTLYIKTIASLVCSCARAAARDTTGSGVMVGAEPTNTFGLGLFRLGRRDAGTWSRFNLSAMAMRDADQGFWSMEASIGREVAGIQMLIGPTMELDIEGVWVQY